MCVVYMDETHFYLLLISAAAIQKTWHCSRDGKKPLTCRMAAKNRVCLSDVMALGKHESARIYSFTSLVKAATVILKKTVLKALRSVQKRNQNFATRLETRHSRAAT